MYIKAVSYFLLSKSVLVNWGCPNKIQQARWLKWLKLFHSSGGWKPEVRELAWLGSGESPSSWLTNSLLLLVSSHSRQRSPSLPLVTNLIKLSPTLMISFNLIYLLKAIFPDIATLGVRVSTQEFWEDTLQSIAKLRKFLMLGFQHYSFYSA